MALAVEEVLSTWRGLERVLVALPDEALERVDVEYAIQRLRVMYHRLTEAQYASGRTLKASTNLVRHGEEVLDRAQRRLAR